MNGLSYQCADWRLSIEAEAVLDEGESLSDFVTECVLIGIASRRAQTDFMSRAAVAVERFVREGTGITPRELLKRMDDRIDAGLLEVARIGRRTNER